MRAPRYSIVIPVYNEGSLILELLDRIRESTHLDAEILVVYDSDDDTTRPYVEERAAHDPTIRPILNTTQPGPAGALRAGFEAATADVVVVTMADGSDDPTQIEPLVRLVERGVVVAAASRYTHGGQQVGGPFLKGLMSRIAGMSLFWLARTGTHDATNSFKGYRRSWVLDVGIESDAGFAMGIEMVAKARRHRQPVAELSTIWLDRDVGSSNFRAGEWIWQYLRWYLYAFGRRIR